MCAAVSAGPFRFGTVRRQAVSARRPVQTVIYYIGPPAVSKSEDYACFTSVKVHFYAV